LKLPILQNLVHLCVREYLCYQKRESPLIVSFCLTFQLVKHSIFFFF
jgi:hypothetical protein